MAEELRVSIPIELVKNYNTSSLWQSVALSLVYDQVAEHWENARFTLADVCPSWLLSKLKVPFNKLVEEWYLQLYWDVYQATYKRHDLSSIKKKKIPKRKWHNAYVWIGHLLQQNFWTTSISAKDRAILSARIASMLSIAWESEEEKKAFFIDVINFSRANQSTFKLIRWMYLATPMSIIPLIARQIDKVYERKQVSKRTKEHWSYWFEDVESEMGIRDLLNN